MRRLLFVVLLLVALVPMLASAGTPLPAPKHGLYVVAHRGAHEGIPENTLAAYRKAIELGADYVEIDVRTTKDGKFVSVHNDEVDGYTKDAKGPVKSYTLAELKAMDIGSRVDAKWKEERIPTFEEILDLCKGKIGIYLDLKEAPVKELLPIIQARGMERDIIWYASPAELKEVQAGCPECIPMPDPGLESGLKALLEEFKPTVVASVWEYLSRTFVRDCHAAGALVIVDESDPSCWEQAISWGTDGIQTDHPEDLITYLKQRSGK